jgi:SAM-dependent methyltransferase
MDVMTNNLTEFQKISYFSEIKITRSNIYSHILNAAKQYAKGDLIDLGCGTKPYELVFTPYINSYFGVDFEPTMDSNFGESTKADLYANCISTGIEAEKYDTLLSTQVLEHVFETQEFVKESYRLLKPNGIGIFTVPFSWQLHSEPYDYYRFTCYSLEKLFIDAGFQILSIEPMEGAYATLKQMKIISLYFQPKKNIFTKVFQRIRNLVLIPIMNWQALHFDKFFYNNKLCLNYLLIVKK